MFSFQAGFSPKYQIQFWHRLVIVFIFPVLTLSFQFAILKYATESEAHNEHDVGNSNLVCAINEHQIQ